MIRKKKICKNCLTEQYIWSKRMCKKCASLSVKRKPIAKLSVKRKVENVEYLKLRLEYLNEHQNCEAKIAGCNIFATQIHHRAGRIGNLLTDTSLFLAVCGHCHRVIELNPNFAKQHGFSENRL